MSKDEIYADAPARQGSFEFNADVAAVFPDMLARSIPGYSASIEAIGALAARVVRANARCYDLGCSLGAATLAMRQNIATEGCSIIAVDRAPAMIERCRQIVAAEPPEGPCVEIVEADIRQVPIVRASMVVMNYTLQFVPLEARLELLRSIAEGLLDDGVFVLSEKVVDEDPEIEKLLVDLHHDFKRRNHYSELEIARKRSAIDKVLLPESVRRHRERLQDAGFRHVAIWLRFFNFVSIVATK